MAKRKPGYIRIQEFDRVLTTQLVIPHDRDYTPEEKTLLKTRLKRVRLWEEFESFRIRESTKVFKSAYGALSKRQSAERSWKIAAATFQKKLLQSEQDYRVGLERKDYAFMGDPENWSQDAVDTALSRLLENDRKGKLPHDKWGMWDDYQWVYKRLHVDFIQPKDFPTIEAFNLLMEARKDETEFTKRYFDIHKALITKAKPKPEEEAPVLPPAPEGTPIEETEEYKGLMEISKWFGITPKGGDNAT